MSKPKIHPLIITLDRSRLLFCSPNSPQPLALQLPPSVVSDLEVINRLQLEETIFNFIRSSRLHPSSLIIILSTNVYFDRILHPAPAVDFRAEAEKFADTVPLTSVSSKVFKWEMGHRLVSINRDLYESVSSAFQKLGFTVLAVVPSFILGPMGVPEELDQNACRLILKKVEDLKASSFLTDDTAAPSFQAKKDTFLHHNQLILAGLSFLIIGSSIGFLIYSVTRPAKKTVSARTVPVSVPLITPSLTPAAATPSSTLKITDLKIQVRNGTGETGRAARLVALLKEAGFTGSQIGTASVSAGQTNIVYDPAIPADLLGRLKSLADGLYPPVTLIPGAAGANHAVITIGRAP